MLTNILNFDIQIYEVIYRHGQAKLIYYRIQSNISCHQCFHYNSDLLSQNAFLCETYNS